MRTGKNSCTRTCCGMRLEMNKNQEKAKRGAAALANQTKGRARRFIDRKKQANKMACRGR